MKGETVDLAIRALRLSALGAANASSLGGLNEPTVKAMFRRLDNDLERIAELHEKEIAALTHLRPTGSGCPCEPSGSDGLRCPDASGKLLCDPAADRPGEQTAEVAWIDHTLSGVVLRTIGECTRLEDLPHGTKLYAQPRPAGADTNGECKYCNGATEWFTSLRNKTQVVDGRLKTSDVECVFVLGCTECSETLEVRNADAVAASMTGGLGS